MRNSIQYYFPRQLYLPDIIPRDLLINNRYYDNNSRARSLINIQKLTDPVLLKVFI